MAVGALHLLVWKVLIHPPITLLCWLPVLFADWTSNEHRTHKQTRICQSYLFFNLNSFNRVRYGLGLPVGLYLMISSLSALKAILLYFAHLHMACRSTRSLFPPSVELNNILILVSPATDVTPVFNTWINVPHHNTEQRRFKNWALWYSTSKLDSLQWYPLIITFCSIS